MSRTNPIIASFAQVIAPHSRIIDIGAGKGHLARQMAKQLDARVTMVDVAQYNETELALTVCDSRALAFSNDGFDVALLSFVLHHSPDPRAILREALRVARQVIVIENDVRGVARRGLTRLVDSWPALRYGTPPCYLAQPCSQWLEMFQELSRVRPLGRFTLERGFFECFSVELCRLD